ncbi:uncharacterized protein TNCV_5031841 [Trichonephila clavipes]|nr:uncharacterized protein TNCV_5031841 [Trichonephila clavipes]
MSTEISTGAQSGPNYADCGIRLEGVTLTYAVPVGKTISADYCSQFLQHHLILAMRCQRLRLLHSNLPITLPDSACYHVANNVTNLLRWWSWKSLEHPPYSLDKSPCDFNLFL